MTDKTRVETDRPIWITLFGCINELPAEQLARVLGVGGLQVARMKLASQEYLAIREQRLDEQYRMDDALRATLRAEPRAKTVGGPWVPKQMGETGGLRED